MSKIGDDKEKLWKETHSGFNDVLSTGFTPWDSSRVTLSVNSDGFSIDDKITILSLNSSFESSVDWIELEHVDLQSIVDVCNMNEVDREVYHIVNINERTLSRIYEFNKQTR